MGKKRSKSVKPDFVLDCSVTMSWYFKDEANAYANSVRRALKTSIGIVPSLWPLEVANVLVIGERRKRGTEADASRWLQFLQKLPIRIDDETVARAWSDTVQVARSYELSAYDAAYLELAIRLGLPLASLDDELKAAAARAGVPEFKP